MTSDLMKWLEKSIVFNKGTEIIGVDKDRYRRDEYGNIIDFHAYGDTDHEHGWEIGHRNPLSRDGSDTYANKFPQSIRMNRYLGARTPEEGVLSALARALAGIK